MKKKILQLLTLLLVLFGSFYWYSFTSESKKYKLLNEIIADDNLTLFKICSQTSEFELTNQKLKEFGWLEKLAIKFQSLTQENWKIEKQSLKYFNRRLKKFQAIEIAQKCDIEYEIIYTISTPIVSPDGNKVFIKITEDCNCMLGGQSGEYLYEKINGKWKRVRSFNQWVS